MRVIFAGGGTGGHLNPAIAIADRIMRMEPGSEVLFVGTERGIENKLVPAAGYSLKHVKIQGLRRSLSPSNIKTLWLALTSPAEAKKIIREFKPDVAVGTGGFVCWPVIRAAASMGIPTALHESNAVPGVAVKMLEGCVDVIFTNFEETANCLRRREKVIRVGNPLRGGVLVLTPRDSLLAGLLLGTFASLVLQGLLRLPDLGQPRLAPPQLLRQLVPARVLPNRASSPWSIASACANSSDTSCARTFSFSLIRA